MNTAQGMIAEITESPGVAKKIVEKMIGAGGFAADRVVRAHHGSSVGFDDGGAEGRSVSLVEIVRGDGSVEVMALRLGAAVHGIVFGGGDGLEILGVDRPGAPLRTHAEAAGEEGIFAVGFLAASPARIAKDIDVGRPEGESLVEAVIACARWLVDLGAGFGGDDVCPRDGGDRCPRWRPSRWLGERPLRCRRGPRRGGLRSTSCRPGFRGEGWRGASLELRDLLVERQAGDEVVGALVGGEGGVEVGRSGLGERGCGEEKNQKRKHFGDCMMRGIVEKGEE